MIYDEYNTKIYITIDVSKQDALGQISITSVWYQQRWENLQAGIRKWNGSVWSGKGMLWNYV